MSTENQGTPVAGGAEPTTQATPTAGAQQQDEAAQETTDAPAASEDQAQDQEQQPEPKKKGDGGFQRRINRLTADFRAAEARAAAAEAKAQELERRQAQPTQAIDEPKPPRLEDFRSYEEYERADRAYVAERTRRETVRELRAAEAERAARAHHEAEARQMREAAERFNKSAEDIAENYEDLAEVMDDMWRGRIPVIARNDAVAKYLIEESERGPELAYHLANNAEAAERIGKLTPLAQVRALALLEASLPKPNAPATKAPPPPRSVGSRGGSDTKDPAKMSIDEMRKATGTTRIVRDY